jgi:hypothetical protein
MTDLNLLSVINGAPESISRSALPDSPVVPDPGPGRLRTATAAVLRRLAAYVDGDAQLGRGTRPRLGHAAVRT